MGEPTINQKECVQCSPLLYPLLNLFFVSSLEGAILKALDTHFSRHPETSNSARVEFYNKFQRAADDHDRDFVGKCSGDLDTTLIFVGLLLFYPILPR